jgi:flagellar motor switch protein FliG
MGNILRHGIDMYKRTINMKNEPVSAAMLKAGDSHLVPQKNMDTSPAVPQKKKKSSGLIKTSQIPEIPQDTKIRRTAKFFILIGGEQASEIMAEMEPKQIEAIANEIAQIKYINPEEGNQILAEFKNLFSGAYRFSGLLHGGIEAARRILYAAKGPEKGEALLNRAVPESKENLFGFLEEFSPDQLVMFLKSEAPQTTAVILSRLSPKLSAGTVSKLPSELKPEVLKRIAHQDVMLPEVLEQISAALKEKVRNISGRAQDYEIDGVQTLAAILKQGDYSFGDKIINKLESDNPEIGKNLKEKLYTLDDIVNMTDRQLQDKLAEMSEQSIAILLKGRNQEFTGKILSCVSAGRRQQIREESDIIGAVTRRDSDAAASEFLSWFRHARENGEIILSTDKDVYL